MIVVAIVVGGLALVIGLWAVFAGFTGMVESFAHMIGDAMARRAQRGN